MGTLKEDINEGSEWIVKAFKADKLNLDYSIRSFIEIDNFFNKHTSNGKTKQGGRLSKGLGSIIFSVGSYIGNTIIKNVPGSVWVTDDGVPEDEINISVELPDKTIIFPVQRVMKRFKNGDEDSIYVYGYQLAKDFTGEAFDETYWKKIKRKPWWKIW